jgi:hypothetical protein
MARDFFINGESLVTVKGRSDSAIGTLAQLGLTEQAIRLRFNFKQDDMDVDAWGGRKGEPVDVQTFLQDVMIYMDLVHYDESVLEACWLESTGSIGPAFGQLNRAGSRLGNNLPRFAASNAADANGIVRTGNHYIGLNIASPQQGKPWRFLYAYLYESPIEYPLGTDRSVVRLTWRSIAYSQDPWNGGLGAAGYVLFDRTPDN